MLLLSVIVCTYNRADLLRGCLEILANQISILDGGTVEVIVVNNNCSDTTENDVNALCNRYPWLRQVFEPKQGLSNARNKGAIEATAEYVCYVDDDARPGPGYVGNVLDVITKYRPDILGGPVLPFFTTSKPNWFQDSLETRYYAEESGFGDYPVSGGNFVIRTNLLHRLGLFSPDLGMVGRVLRLGEERELLERYRRAACPGDRRIYYSVECVVYHHVPAYKMSVRYFIVRAYQSGKLNEIIRWADTGTSNSSGLLPRQVYRRRILGGKAKKRVRVHMWLRIVHGLARSAGAFVQRIEYIAASRGRKRQLWSRR